MRTSNPAMQAFVHPEVYRGALAQADSKTMSYSGTIRAAGILTTLCAGSAVFTWTLIAGGQATLASVMPWALGAMVVALIGGLTIHRRPQWAPILAPIYALVEGVFVGALSALIPVLYMKSQPGLGADLVMQAMLLTFGILFALLAAFSVGAIRLGPTAVKVISVATIGVFFYYIVGMVFGMLGADWFPRLGWQGGMIGIGFSLFVVVLASLNLVLDFQFIEAGVQNKAPKYMEWYGAFGLLVTLVWLYIETLRLLAKLRSE
jgi:uncharacterized YccA/Bax inhibitor family protein